MSAYSHVFLPTYNIMAAAFVTRDPPPPRAESTAVYARGSLLKCSKFNARTSLMSSLQMCLLTAVDHCRFRSISMSLLVIFSSIQNKGKRERSRAFPIEADYRFPRHYHCGTHAFFSIGFYCTWTRHEACLRWIFFSYSLVSLGLLFPLVPRDPFPLRVGECLFSL